MCLCTRNAKTGMLIIFIVTIISAVSAADGGSWNHSVESESVFSASVSADGSFIAIGGTDGGLYTYEGSGMPLWQKTLSGSLVVMVNDEGSSIVVGSRESLENNKGVVRSFDRNGTEGWKYNTGWVAAMAGSRTFDKVLVGTRSGGVVLIEDGGKGSIFRDIRKDQVAHTVAISSNGMYAGYSLYEAKPTLNLINLKRMQMKQVYKYFRKNSWPVNRMVMSERGEYTSAVTGEGSQSLLFMVAKNGTRLWAVSLPAVHDIAIADNGEITTAIYNNSVTAFDRSGNTIWQFSTNGPARSLSMTRDGSKIAAGTSDGRLYVLSGNGTLLWSYQTEDIPVREFTLLRINQQGDTLLAIANGNLVQYHRLGLNETGEETAPEPNVTGRIQEQEIPEDDQVNGPQFINFSSLASADPASSARIVSDFRDLFGIT